MTTNDAHYRKYNDRSLNSSTYHKKDGTPVRGKLKAEVRQIVRDWLEPTRTDYIDHPCENCGHPQIRLIETPRRCNRTHLFCSNCRSHLTATP